MALQMCRGKEPSSLRKHGIRRCGTRPVELNATSPFGFTLLAEKPDRCG